MQQLATVKRMQTWRLLPWLIKNSQNCGKATQSSNKKQAKSMRLTCPNCDAIYEVGDSVIPEEGRDVQCSACGTTWFQESARALRRSTASEDSSVAQDPVEAVESDSDPEAEAESQSLPDMKAMMRLPIPQPMT